MANNTDLGSILSAAVASGTVAQLNGGTYTVSQPIVINITSTIQGALGLNGGGATINSTITNGQPVIEIVVGPGVDLRYLDLSNFNIVGNGAEGDGIKIVADGNDRWDYNWNINNVNVSHVGGYGLDLQGSIFEGLVSNSTFNNNGQGGAYIGNSAGGGIASALHWFGGGASNNGGPGIELGAGMRDLSVSGANFTGNHGSGIDAPSGITSVTDSGFADNQGAGITYQVYGNFNDNTFTNSTGAQSEGITGYTIGETTMVGDSATGSPLANLTGSGSLLETGNTGSVTAQSSMTTGGIGTGDAVSVSHSTVGVALPTLQAITAATVAPEASSPGTSGLDAAMHAAFASGTVEQVTSATSYSVSAPIVINITNSAQAVGIDLGGAKIESMVGGGQPVIEIIVAAGVTVGSLSLSNLSIFGNGSESDGIKIVSNGTTQLNLVNVNVEHTGGIGLDVIGNVTGSVTDSWMNGNALGGAQFANGPNGGVASGLQWVGGGFRLNDVAGLILNNGAHDMSVSGAYFVQNNGPGIDAASGITSVLGSGFENNTGGGAVVQGSANFTDDTFSTYGPQITAVGGYLASGQQVTITGPDAEYYGSGSGDPIILANLQGQGTLAVAGAGNVIAGPGITVTGGNPVVDPPNLATAWGGGGSGGGGSTPPAVTAALAHDTGASATDNITNNDALTGTADANAVVHFMVDGSAIGTTATANASGAWAFTPSGLADGQHTVVASETNAAGQTGTASLTFTLDTTAPAVTEAVAASGPPALTGTGDANATVHFTVDGSANSATATANASGAWAFTPSGLAAGQHTVVASETDLAGNTGSAAQTFTVSGGSGGGGGDPVAQFTSGVIANGDVTLMGTTGQAGDQVTIYDGPNWLGAATTDANGNFTFTAPADPTVINTYGAYTTDPSGNIWHGTTPLTIDPSSPTPPTVTAALAHDTGASATDHVTNNDALTGTADPNAVVHFTVDGSAISATATANASGDWAYTPNLADGAHTIVASETNAAGLTGTASLSLTLDTTPPHVTETVAASGAPALTGTGDANATVHFTVDGSAISATATANATGAWAFTPSGLAIGPHTVVASETDLAGNTGSASLSVTVPGATHPTPTFTGETVANGHVTLTGTTGQAGDQINLYDGNSWLGAVTTDSSGHFSYVASEASGGAANTYGDYAVDPSGAIWHGTNQVIVGGTAAATLNGTAGSALVNANGANDTIQGGAADQIVVGAGKVTVAFASAGASTASAPDAITGFMHGTDKIDFTSIAGITASGGVPTFQGALTGSGNLTLNPHSVATIEVGTQTEVLANTTATAETVTTANVHAATMEIVLQGVHLGLTASDFHHA